MNSPDAIDWTEPCESTDALLDAYIDGKLDAPTAERFEAHQATCPACAEALAFARDMGAALAALPMQPCPEPVTRSVYREVRTRQRRAWLQDMRGRVVQGFLPALRPALAVAAVAVVFWWVRPENPPPPAISAAEPTQEEVDEALAQLKWTMGYVSDVGRKAGVMVRHDVIQPHVVAPMQQTVQGVVAE